jgi:hypothetical protein
LEVERSVDDLFSLSALELIAGWWYSESIVAILGGYFYYCASVEEKHLAALPHRLSGVPR